MYVFLDKIQYSNEVFFTGQITYHIHHHIMHDTSFYSAMDNAYRLNHASIDKLIEATFPKSYEPKFMLLTLKKSLSYPSPYQTTSANATILWEYTKI
jgi:hypothetical protein